MTDTTAPDAINQADDIVTIDEIRAIFSSGTVPMEAAVAIQNATSPAALRAELREIAAAHRRLAAHGAGEGLLLREIEARARYARSEYQTEGSPSLDRCDDKLPGARHLGAAMALERLAKDLRAGQFASASSPKITSDLVQRMAATLEQWRIDEPEDDWWQYKLDFRDAYHALLTPPTDAGSTTREGGEGVRVTFGPCTHEWAYGTTTGGVSCIHCGDARGYDSTEALDARQRLATTSSPDASPDSGEEVNCFGIPGTYRGWRIKQGIDDRFYADAPADAESWEELREEIDFWEERNA